MSFFKNTLIATASAVALVATGASAETAATTELSPQLKDNTTIVLTGTVGKITDSDQFELYHSGGMILVDTNDTWPSLFKADAGDVIKTGDRVSVYGRVDKNLFSAKELDAYEMTVYGDSYNRTYRDNKYFVSAKAGTNTGVYPYADDYAYYNSYDKERVRVTGVISKIVNDEEFILNYGSGDIQVETNGIVFSSTDKLSVGDSVTVYGDIDNDWLERKEVDADRIVRTNTYSTRG